jgi:hypothetical protein
VRWKATRDAVAELKLDLAVDARQAVKGVDNFADALDDVVDSLEDVAKAGDKAEDGLVDSFRDIARKAKIAGDDAGDNLGKGLRKGASEGLKKGTSEGLKEAGDEAASSGREAAASFSGGFEDVADFVQETLANALGGFGPMGAAAGVALAAILGTVLSGAQAAQDRLNEAREAAGDLASTLYENNGRLPIEDAIQRVLELLPKERGASNPFETMLDGFVDLGTNIDAVKRAAKEANAPVDTFVRGLTGADLDATRDALKAVDDAIAGVKERAHGEINLDNGAALSQLEALKSQLVGVQTGAMLARDTLATVGASYDSAAYVAKVEAIGQAWQDAMTDASAYVDEQDGVTSFDWSTYLADAESTLAAANNYKKLILTVPADIRAEAESVFKSQGAKAAEAYVTSYRSASAADRARFEAVARENGTAAGKAQGTAMAGEAERAAQAKAQGWGTLKMPVKAEIDDWNVRNYKPPTVYIPGRVVVGGKQVV